MATVLLPCAVCKKKTPHRTPGVGRVPTGEKTQPMECAVCGCVTDVRTGEKGEHFQENVDTPYDTDLSELAWRWTYPVYIMTATTESAVVVDADGKDCVLLYTTKELAELYVEQSGDHSLAPDAIETKEQFRDALRHLQQGGVSHVLWDSTYQPKWFKFVPVDELLADLDR